MGKENKFMTSQTVRIDLNRVEGDLEFELDIENNVITDARCIGTLYRGFEQILLNRAPRDAMVITPRVCGICGTAHLYSAVLALEHAWQLPVPPNATRIRNLCLMAEGVQNDLRQTFLFFTVDFCDDLYQKHELYDEVVSAFAPFEGAFHRETLEFSKKMLEIVAIFGGQWPHSSYMLPGGVVTEPTSQRVIDCLDIVNTVSQWYEQRIIGDTLDNFLALDSAEAFFTWVEKEKPAHSGLGILTRFARSISLHQRGVGTPHMLSFGAYCDPETWVAGAQSDQHWVKSGFYNGETGIISALNQNEITEHVRYSWFQDYEGGKHPWQGETVPDYQPQTDRYTWAKAPRYADKVVQTGPLAELLIDGDALMNDLLKQEGGNAWLRQCARIRRVAYTFAHIRRSLEELLHNLNEPHIIAPSPSVYTQDGEGYGLVTAARGALGHWVRIRDGVIDKYQIITPTAWNASPKDSQGVRGHWEQSLIGLAVDDPENPVEIGHVIRSHDPCLVCTVHFVGTGKKITYRP